MKHKYLLIFIFNTLIYINTSAQLITCKICHTDHHKNIAWSPWKKSTAPTRADQIPQDWVLDSSSYLHEGFPTTCGAKYRISEKTNPISDEQKAAGVEVRYEVKFAHACQCAECKTAQADQLLRYHIGCFAPLIKFLCCCTNPYENY